MAPNIGGEVYFGKYREDGGKTNPQLLTMKANNIIDWADEFTIDRTGKFVASRKGENTLIISSLLQKTYQINPLNIYAIPDVVEVEDTYNKIKYIYDDRLIVPIHHLTSEQDSIHTSLQIIHFCFGEGCSNFCLSSCGNFQVDPGE